MIEMAASAMFLMFGLATMIVARRWNNEDPDAGGGIAGWGLFLIIFACFCIAAGN